MQRILVVPILAILAILLAACGPSQAEHDAAVATQVALLQATASAEAGQPTVRVSAEGEPTLTADPAFPLPADAACVPGTTSRVIATVEDVYDGVSIGVDINGADFEVRYIGVDAPQGDAVLAANRALVEGTQVLLITDVTDVDEYGRWPRYVIADGVFVNAELLRQGVAYFSPEEPDLACQDFFRDLQP